MPNFAKYRSKTMMESTKKLGVAAVRKKRSKSKSPVGPMCRSAKEAAHGQKSRKRGKKTSSKFPPAEVLLVAFPPRDHVPKINSIPHERLSELRVCDNLRLATTTVVTTQRSCTQRSQVPCTESLYLSAPSLRETCNAIPRVANSFHSEAR